VRELRSERDEGRRDSGHPLSNESGLHGKPLGGWLEKN
jgi:hypothetical protein